MSQFVNLEEQKVLSFQEFDQRYPDMLNWLDFCQLTSSIPALWKNIIANNIYNDGDSDPNSFDYVMECAKPGNFIYKSLINRMDVLEKYYLRSISGANNISCDYQDYEYAFKKLWRIADSTKLRDFQYRLLLGKIPCNAELFHWHLIDSDLCTFCGLETENLEHIFMNCTITKPIWDKLYDLTGTHIAPTFVDIFLNTFPSHDVPKVFHFLVLLTKQYLYRMRCLKERITVAKFETEVYTTFRIELYNANQNFTVAKCLKKWKTIYPEVTESYI